MSTIGEELKQREDQLTQERITRRSDMLRKFVREDLLLALQTAIGSGHEDYAPVLAPKEIRHLFAARLGGDVSSPYEDKRSVYYDVWRELDEWATSEDLFIRTGHNMDKDNRVRPWADYDWGGSLGIRKKKPEPAKPTPPAPQRVMQGATLTLKEAILMMSGSCAITFVLTYFLMRH